jgi:hypothetical protein
VVARDVTGQQSELQSKVRLTQRRRRARLSSRTTSSRCSTESAPSCTASVARSSVRTIRDGSPGGTSPSLLIRQGCPGHDRHRVPRLPLPSGRARRYRSGFLQGGASLDGLCVGSELRHDVLRMRGHAPPRKIQAGHGRISIRVSDSVIVFFSWVTAWICSCGCILDKYTTLVMENGCVSK